MTETKKPLNLIATLLDLSLPFPQKYLHIFSDITPADLEEIQKIWPQVPVIRKISLLHDLEAMMEVDSLLACDDFARFALKDEDPTVRSRAIGILWDCEDTRLAREFGQMLQHDPSEVVRAAAAAALGKFVLMGELEEISTSAFERTYTQLMECYRNEVHDEVSQEILRSLAYCSKKDVVALIQQAFNSGKKGWKTAALEGMGRLADARWKEPILATFSDEDDEIQFEAIRAAGELELKAARKPLLVMLAEETYNNDLRFQIIWALSKIGGELVRDALHDLLEHSDDEDEIDVLELALENLDLTDENPTLDII